MTQLVFSRHFAALGCGSILACVVAKLDLLPTAESFALYGVLHAAALVIALRGSMPVWRKGFFMLMAGALCVLMYRAGLFGRSLASAYSGNLGLYLPLGVSAAIGALSYGVAIRELLRIRWLTAGCLAMICAGCVPATYLGAFMAAKIHGLGLWWLAVLWWFAFSVGLWLTKTRQHSRAVH
jgi:hypothetical protein